MAAAFESGEGGDGFESIRDWFADLPEDEYPTLKTLAPHLAGADADDRFAFGLKTLFIGLEHSRRDASHEHSAPKSPPPTD